MGADPQATGSTTPRPDLSTAGEFELITAVTTRLTTGASVLVGPGDDAAVVRAPDSRVVVTTDVLVEGVHFRRDWSSAVEVGRKAAAQNCADVAAMGARATALVMALAAPADLPLDWVTGLADGLREESERAGAYVVGGDMARADQVVVSVTALGDLGGRRPVLRSGAFPGDLVVLAGSLGMSAAGLAVHLAGDPATSTAFAALGALHRVPVPDYSAGIALADAGASAMLDVSDGLLQDLGHIARASGVALRVDAEALRADVTAVMDCAVTLGGDPWAWVLGGGEDHALAATIPAGSTRPPGVRVIGVVEEGSGVRVEGHDAPVRRGWDHFGR